MKRLSTAVSFLIGLCGLVEPCVAEVVRFEVLSIESPAFEGRVFGSVGTYDRIVARATIAVAPSDPHNAIIVDIDRTPRNAQGLVEATADVEILRPTIAANGNRRLLYDVVNRGGKRALAMFNDSMAGNEPVKAADAGTGFLMSRGYTVVWSGWQGDLRAGSGRKLIKVPTVAGSLREALNALDGDRTFLTKGGVFTDDQIDAYMEIKWEEVYAWEHQPAPVEYKMYYSV